MKFILHTNYSAHTLKIPVQAKKDCTMFVDVQDCKLPATFLNKRSYAVQSGGEDCIYVQMPLTGNNILVSVYEDAQDKDAIPSGFDVLLDKVRLLSLPSQMKVVNLLDSKLREWMTFAQRFCFNISVLPCYEDKYYVSQDSTFKIKLVEKILDENGNEDVTPMRVNRYTKIMEASKSKLLPMTVPGRMAVSNHEYSHLNMNEDEANELEADLNGIVICLGTGYPKYEVRQVFLNTFFQDQIKDSPEIKERLLHIERFIDEYETLEFEHL